MRPAKGQVWQGRFTGTRWRILAVAGDRVDMVVQEVGESRFYKNKVGTVRQWPIDAFGGVFQLVEDQSTEDYSGLVNPSKLEIMGLASHQQAAPKPFAPGDSAEDYSPPPKLPERDELRWVGIDLDETLARGIWPEPGIGPPIQRNVDKARKLAGQGWKLHVHTSRPWHEYERVKQWLHHNGVPHHGIQMGKPLYAAYIDDRAIFAGDADWTPKPSEVRRAEPS